jgi:hypothetical protein
MQNTLENEYSVSRIRGIWENAGECKYSQQGPRGSTFVLPLGLGN